MKKASIFRLLNSSHKGTNAISRGVSRVDNPNANRVYATFRIWGQDLDPDQITRIFGVIPSISFKKGDTRKAANKWRHGYWEINTSDKVQGTDLSIHIEWLLERIEPVRREIELLIRQDYDADIFCFWESLTGHGGPTFEPDLLARLGTLGLRLGLDIYFSE